MKFLNEWVQNTLEHMDVHNTRVSYGRALNCFWAWYEEMGQPDLTVKVVNQYRLHMNSLDYSSATIRIHIAAIKMAVDLNARPGTTDERLDVMDIKKIKSKYIKSDNYSVTLSVDERERIFATCDTETMKGVRDLALLTLIFYLGMRRGEVLALDLSDYDTVHQVLFIREAKGNKNRVVPLHPLVIERVDRWLKYRPYVAKHTDALFVGFQKNKGQRMNGANLYCIMVKACNDAGVSHYHPHDARSTFITSLHDKGVNVGDIQKLVGHSDPSTTMSYVRANFANLRRAVLELD